MRAELIIHIDTNVKADGEIDIKRVLIQLGLIKEAERRQYGGLITYTVMVNDQQRNAIDLVMKEQNLWLK